MSCACDDGCRETIDGSEDGRQARSFSGGSQCACKASSACESGGGSSPNECQLESLSRLVLLLLLLQTTTYFLRQISSGHEDQMCSSLVSSSLEEGRGSGVGGEAL